MKILKLIFIVVFIALTQGLVASYSNEYDVGDMRWYLEADKVEGIKYFNPSERPENTTIVFTQSQAAGETLYICYYNVTLTDYEFVNPVYPLRTDIDIPTIVEWNAQGTLGVQRGQLVHIASDAFYNKPITSVNIPSSIIGIKLPCFRKCGDLECIKLGGYLNTEDLASHYYSNYTVRDGVLYNKDMTKLLKYPEGKKDRILVVPETVKELASYSLSNTKLTAVHFLGDCPEIPSTAFSGSNFVIYRHTENEGWPESPQDEWTKEWGAELEGIMVYDFPANGTDGDYYYAISDSVLYKYEKDENGDVTITDVPECINGLVSIPDTLAGANVVSIGYKAFEDCSSVTDLIIPEGVKSIGGYAFSYCSSLESVTIPASVESIAEGAFLCCSSITQVHVSDLKAWCEIDHQGYICGETNPLSSGGDLYLNGDVVQELNIPEGVTKIGSFTFSGCASIRYVEIPEGVVEVKDEAFARCSSLETVSISVSVENIAPSAFYACEALEEFVVDSGSHWYKSTDGLLLSKDGTVLCVCPRALLSVVVPQSVKVIGDAAFYGCSALESVELPDGLLSIGYCAFDSCSMLKEIRIPNSVTNIGEDAFYDCSSLVDAVLSRGLTEINICLFSRCSSLTSIDIPSGVTNIGHCAFEYCTSLAEVAIPDSVVCVQNGAFRGCADALYDKTIVPGVEVVDGWVVDYDYDDSPAGKLVLGGVRGVANWALSDLQGLTDVVFTDSVKYIGISAFEYCKDLKSVYISSNVVDIGSYSFAYCDSLTNITVETSNPSYMSRDGMLLSKDMTELLAYPSASGTVTIPDGVTKVCEGAFAECASLEKVIVPASVRRIEDNTFWYCEALCEVVFMGDMAEIEMNVRNAFIGTPWFENAVFDPPENDDIENAAKIIGETGSVKGTNFGATDEDFEDGMGLGENTVWWKWTAPASGSVTFDTLGSHFDTILGVICTEENIDFPEIVYNDDYDESDWYESLVTFAAESGKTYFVAVGGYYDGNIVLNWKMADTYPIPELPSTATAEEVTAALGGSADAKLVANITDAANYAAYREWAQGVKTADGSAVAGAEAVKNAPYSWLSYALDAGKLIANALEDGDVTIDTFENAAADGAFDFTVSVKDITVGDGALEENIKKVFDIEGVEDLAAGTFSADAVDVNVAVAEGGKVKFTVTPKTDSEGVMPDRFFFKVKMK